MPPLRYDRLGEHARAVVWDARGDAGALADQLPPAWRTPLPAHPDRARETLGARRALLALAPQLAEASLRKDSYGKPSVDAHPPLHFSLSHSHGYAAALVSERPCGVDLQRRVEKIVRLRSKFERPDERAFVAAQADEVAALHVLWGAKESLFKLWGRRCIDWHEHLRVGPFTHVAGGGSFRAEVRKGADALPAKGFYRWVGAWCLVAVVGQLGPTVEEPTALG